MENNEFKLIMTQIESVQSSMTTQFAGVNGRLDKINGRVGKTEDEIQLALIERAKNRETESNHWKEIEDMKEEIKEIDNKERNHVSVCPVLPKLPELDKRIRTLEDSNLSTITKSGLVKSALATLAVIVSIAVGMMKITENHAEAASQRIKMSQDTMINNQAVIYRELLKIIDENKKDTIK